MHVYAIPSTRTVSKSCPDRNHSDRRTLHPLLAVAMIAVLLIGLIGGASWNGGESGPSEPTRFAAVPVGSPEAQEGSPENPLTVDDFAWMQEKTTTECAVEPMSGDEYARIVTTVPYDMNRSYELIGPAKRSDAEAAVETLWMIDLCETRFEEYNLYTETGLFLRTPTADNLPILQETAPERFGAIQQWSTVYESVPLIQVVEGMSLSDDTRAYWESLDADGQNPIDALPGFVGWDPANARMLDDGRMIIPQSVYVYAENPLLNEEAWNELNQQYGNVNAAFVLKNVDGQWLIDDQVQLCMHACDAVYVTGWTTPVAMPKATPVGTPKD